jgi:TP901 family phage tail tape measure protein
MAGEASRTIELIFAAVDHTSQVVSGITEGVTKLGEQFDKVTDPLANFTESLLKIEGAAVAVGAALVGLAIKGAVDFQSALFDLRKVLDDADGDFRQFAGLAIEISNRYGESGTQVLEAATNFKQAGFTAAESFRLAEVAIQALKITEFQGNEAALAFIQTLKGFDEPASAAARILDVLNEVSNVYAVDSKQLGDALARIAPIAKQTGFSIEEITAVLTPGIEVFQDGEIVARAFVTTLQRLVSDEKPVADALAQLGVAQTAANGALRSGKDILHDVQVAFQSLDPSQKLHIANLLAGTDQAAKAVIVFDGLAKTNAVLATANQAAGSAMRELDIRMAAAQEQGERLLAIFDNVRILFGGLLLENFQKIQASGITLGLTLQNMIKADTFAGLTNLLNSAEQSFATFVDNLAKALPTAFAGLDFSGFELQITELTTALSTLFGGVDLTTPKGLQAALQGIVDLGADVIAFNKGLVIGFTQVKTAVELLLSPFGLAQEGAAKLFGEIGAFAVTYTVVSPLFGLLADSFRLLHTTALLAQEGVLALNTAMLTSPVALAGVGLALAAVGVGYAAYKLSIDKASDALDAQAAAHKRYLDSSTAISAEIQKQALGFNVITDSSAGFTAGIHGITGAMGVLIGGFTGAVPSIEELGAELVDLGAKSADLQATWHLATEDLSIFVEGLKRQPIAIVEAKQAIDEYLASVREVGGVTRDATLAGDLATQGYHAQMIAVTDLETGTVRYTQALVFSGQAATEATDTTVTGLSKVQEEALKAQKQVNDFAVEWEKIQSEERIATFRLQAEVDIAAIQAGTEQIKAAFESINETIKSTGDTLSSLVQSLTEVSSGSGAGHAILELLEEENRRRQEALDLQKQLVESQVAYLNAVIDRLSQGEATIQITSDGLEQDLEQFMMHILERIQIKASADAQQFLLGL